MKAIIKWARSRLTMEYKRELFYDIVNKKIVKEYVDKDGVRWMAQKKWGFRTKIKPYKKYERRTRGPHERVL